MRGKLFLVVALVGALFVLQAHSTRVDAQQPQMVRVFIDLPTRAQNSDLIAIRALGGNIRNQYVTTTTISIEIPAVALPALAAFPQFFNIRPVPTITAVEDQLDWGVNQVNADNVWGGTNGAVNVASGTITGAGVKVGVIDTGIDRNHPDLAANVAGGRNWVLMGQWCWGTTCYGGTVDPNKWDDDDGHGTHVAGTIAALDNGIGMIGVAPKASLYGYKVLDMNGSGYMDDAAAAVEYASGLTGPVQMDVINMSFGCTGCNYGPMETAVNSAYARGVVLVAAAGNNGAGTDTTIYPAKHDSVIAVAATCGPTATSNCSGVNNRAAFSSQGPAVEIAAPGDYIKSTLWNDTYAIYSGTSMASPHVAGVAALVKAANPGWSAAQVRSRLTSTATDLGTPGRDTSFGYGLVNAAAAVGGATPPPPPPPTSVHDMAVTAASASPSSVTVGASTNVSVTVANEGNHSESAIAVTLRDGQTGPVLGTQNVSLGTGANTTLQFAWNTTGASTGTHTLYASVATHTGETDTADNSRTTNVTVNAPAPLPPQNTGFLGCTANAAVRSGSGDNNGFQTSPANACADDSLYARDDNSGRNSSTSCTNSGKDRHSYYNYGLPVESGATIQGIEIRLDAWVDSASSTRFMCVQLSWDGGVSWTAAKSTSSLSTSQQTFTLGSATDTWGHTWTADQLSNANFRVRVTDVASSTSRDFRLDYVGTRVTFTP